jgi:hypothetical protein
VNKTPVQLKNVQLAAMNDVVRMNATVVSGGTSYTGQAQGKVAVEGGKLVALGPITISAEGVDLSGPQADAASSLLLQYGNGYLAAAPGLKVDTAEITPAGNIHVTGTAPDKISYQP